MENLRIVSDYKDNEDYRLSFNRLSNKIFGIDFEKWYQSGFWNSSYVCHSYIDKDTVVSNVSVSIVQLLIYERTYKAILIGTVMTHSDYRNRGLSKNLMKLIIEKYEKGFDLMYLFANKSALGFYPQFGFKPVKESLFSVEINYRKAGKNDFKKLDISKSGDLNLLKSIAFERCPVSTLFGVINGQSILLWYCLYVVNDHIYYLPDKKAILIFKIENTTLIIYDIISKEPLQLKEIIERFSGINEAVFCFTPDDKTGEYKIKEFEAGDVLFVRSKTELFPKHFKYPVTALA